MTEQKAPFEYYAFIWGRLEVEGQYGPYAPL